MGDPITRRHNQMSRMRQRLKKKREALADFFDYKLYIAFVFKDKKKGSALFEAAEVVPVMTNNYEDKIMQGVKKDIYSYESSRELLDQDVVQLHVPRYVSMRKDLVGCTQDMDFFLWPRGDILCVRCFVFSRWKDQIEEPFRLIQADFMFFSSDYEFHLKRLTLPRDETWARDEEEAPGGSFEVKDKADGPIGGRDCAHGPKERRSRACEAITSSSEANRRGGKEIILNNPEQSLFLFVRRQRLDAVKPPIVKLNGICLHLPQDQLMSWGMGSVDEVLRPFMT